MVLFTMYETTFAYHRVLLENSRRTAIINVLKTVDEPVLGATTSRRGLELISAHAKLAKVLYILRVLFKHIEHKARYSYKGISPSEASWWLHLTIYDQNRFRMPIIPRIPDFTNVHFYSRATTVYITTQSQQASNSALR